MPNSDFAIDLQQRDLALLRDLFECRVMSVAHISALHFGGKHPAAKKRLQKLKSAGLVSERSRHPFEPSVLSLTRNALILLRDEGILSEYPNVGLAALERRACVGKMTVNHELAVLDVKVALQCAVRENPTFAIPEFTTWPLLHQLESVRPGRNVPEIVKPDGFIRIQESEAGGGVHEHCLYLELDRSTETLDTLVTRAQCYLDHYRSGGFAAKHGAPQSAFKEYPFRVLVVCKSAERRNNIAERLLHGNPPILTLVWLSTFEEMKADPLGGIWIRPVDYRDAIAGTPFHTELRPRKWGYRRQGEREHLVERRIKKHRLLDDTGRA